MGTPKARRRKKQRFREALLKKKLEDNIQCTVEEPVSEVIADTTVEEVIAGEPKELPNALKAVEEKVVPKATKPAPKRQTRKKATTTTTTKKKTTRRRKSSSTS
jgi:hypothetical protein